MRAPNMSWVIPYLTVVNVEKSADFYQKAFSFELQSSATYDDDAVSHAEMKYKDMVIMIGMQGKYGNETVTPNTSHVLSPMTLFVYVDDVDAYYKHAVANGAISVTEPEDAFWGDRYCSVTDIDGFSWCFGTHLGENK